MRSSSDLWIKPRYPGGRVHDQALFPKTRISGLEMAENGLLSKGICPSDLCIGGFVQQLAEAEPDFCVCGTGNAPGASFCVACGDVLGAEPSFVAGSDWKVEPEEFFDLRESDLQGETPRLWRTGGPGAWYLTQTAAGIARVRVLNSGGFAERPDGLQLGRFSDIQAVEATRRGLYCVSASALITVLRPFVAPWLWMTEPLVREQEGRGASGLAPASGGQLYRLTRENDRVQLFTGSGVGGWRELASASANGARDSWLDLVVAASGDAMFWGGGLVGTFERRRQRMVTKAVPAIADLPLAITERMAVRPPGDGRGWTPSSPVLVLLEDQSVGLLEWGHSSPLLRMLPEKVPALLAAVSVEGAVLARAEGEVLRLSSGEGAVVTMARASAAMAQDAAAAPERGGAVFIASDGTRTQAEFIARGDRLPVVRDTIQVDGSGAMPSGAGFEPLAICGYTPQSGPLHRVWIALDHGAGHRTGAIQRIRRVRRS